MARDDSELMNSIMGDAPPPTEAAEAVAPRPKRVMKKPEVDTPPQGNEDPLINLLKSETEIPDEETEPEAEAEVDQVEPHIEEEDTESDQGEEPEVDEVLELADDEPISDTEVDTDDYLDVSDDDLIEVKIDGKTEYRTLGDLKASLSAEGAIQGRLRDATEERKSAIAERAAGTLELEDKRQQLVTAVGQLQEQLFPPLVGVPDESLRATDPQGYLLQESQYRQDQQRIAQNKNQLAVNLQEQQRQREANLQQWRQGQAQELARRVPAFAEPTTSKAAADSIVKVANHYGVTPQELADLGDSRLFHMAHDVGKYLDLLERAKVTTPSEVVKEAKKVRAPRRLRAGTAQRNAKARQQDKSQKKVTARARNSGRVDDIAATLLRPG
jgi:hypothetical protein